MDWQDINSLSTNVHNLVIYTISLSIKLRLYASIILPMSTYAAETWKASVKNSRKVDVFHLCCLWRILHIWYYNHITNEEVLRQSNMSSLSTMIAYCHLWLARHIIQMESSRIPKQALQWILPRRQWCSDDHNCHSTKPFLQSLESSRHPVCFLVWVEKMYLY